jgi:hypothetical protein
MAHFKTSILAAIYQNYKIIAENKLIPKIHIIQQIQQLEIFQDLSYDDLSEVANGSEICKTQHELRCKECLIWIKKGNFSINNIPIDESNRLIWYKADTPEILSALEEGIALITNITPVLLLLNIYPEILQKFSKYVSIYSKQGTNVRITFH